MQLRNYLTQKLSEIHFHELKVDAALLADRRDDLLSGGLSIVHAGQIRSPPIPETISLLQLDPEI